VGEGREHAHLCRAARAAQHIEPEGALHQHGPVDVPGFGEQLAVVEPRAWP
jgi:hypothetical protein